MFEQIDEASTQEELNDKERYWIKYYNSNNKIYGYNLDSGGSSGGTKSESTKRKIGESTKVKWANQETANKMREGLRKGTETMKNNARKYPFTCPICKKTFYYQKNIAIHKKYCSIKCANIAGCWKKGSINGAAKMHQQNVQLKSIIKNDIIEWVLQNKTTVDTCPYNNITSTLYMLREMLETKYNLKDLRSIFICFGVKNLKELLNELKKIIYISKENVC